MTIKPAVHVVAAAVIDRRGRVLIAQRPEKKHLAGMWEFPGGKVEPGETRTAALRRELEEELGIRIGQPRPLLKLNHTYAHAEVLLDVWVVRRFSGKPRGLDGQALRWCTRAALEDAGLLPADRPVIAALLLPQRLTVRETRHYRLDDFRVSTHGAVAGAVGAGAAGGVDFGGAAQAGGVGAALRSPLRGALCNDVEEARAAARGGTDFVALRSPLQAAALERLCADVAIPVFAPGLEPERAWALGASGVNALGAGPPGAGRRTAASSRRHGGRRSGASSHASRRDRP